MKWYEQAESLARNDPSVRVLMDRARRHRMQAAKLPRAGAHDAQHDELEARRLETEAERFVMVAIAKAGVEYGEFKQYSTRQHPELGLIIEVETEQGWNPDPFWTEASTHAGSQMSY